MNFVFNFGCVEVVIWEDYFRDENKYFSVGIANDVTTRKYFGIDNFSKIQDYIISENEKADANSLYHRLFK
jgi:hypothetical protein